MRVLVTGGAGYVGSHTVRRLVAAGHDVWVYDNLSTGHQEAVIGARVIIGDLCDPRALSAVFSRVRFDAVVHFAAVASVAESVLNPLRYYQQNVANSVTLLESMQNHGIRRLVVSSSCAVYGNPDTIPVNERLEPRPISPYGRSKLVIEQILRGVPTEASARL